MPKGTVKVDVERCKACGFCVEFCPTQVAAAMLKPEALRKAVLESVPAAFKDLNAKAFDAGLKYGLEHPDALPQHASSYDMMEVEI
jgi:ferredoxin